jgi:hypothetical protein
MIRIAAALALCVAAPALAQSVEVAEGNWASIPPVEPVDYRVRISDDSMKRIERIVQAGDCPAIGRRDRVRMKAQFLVQFSAGGTAERVVVKRLGCPEVETIVGSIVLARLKEGFYRPTGVNQTGWYKSSIEYQLN